jgi:hypothetical protein
MTDPASPPLTLKEQKKANRARLLSMAKRPLTEEQLQLLERAERSKQNRRQRKNPATMPDRLARTSAFTPRRQGLITDSNFVRVYEVPGYSVVEVKGRELGSQHRDAIYALFRLPRIKTTVPNPNYRQGRFVSQYLNFYETHTTWRVLLKAMGRVEHLNNLLGIMQVFEEIRQVSFILHRGKSLKDINRIHRAKGEGILPDMEGEVSSLISDLKWDGGQLDSNVVVRFGTTVFEMLEKVHIVSINADVQFRLKSDHAKTFWPFIDSQPSFTYIDEERLAQLAGRDLWGDGETSATRAQFRKECREAFRDMQTAGGLKSWQEEITGSGRAKSRRYHYTHALPRQMELDLLTAKPPQDDRSAPKSA